MGDLLESPRVASPFFSVFLFFFCQQCMTLELLDREAKLGMWYLFGKPKESSPMNEEGKWSSSIVFFLLQILILMYIFVHFVIFAILRGENYMFGHCFWIFCMYQSSHKQDRVFLHRWWDPRQMDHKVVKKNRYDCIACSNGCDHTSTNAPYPIKTVQLSVLGRE